MKVNLTRNAANDIASIYRYTIAKFGHQQADLYIGGLDYAFELLSENPRMGKVIAKEQGRELRRFLYRKHYVVYELKSDALNVAMIRSTRQDIPEDWM